MLSANLYFGSNGYSFDLEPTVDNKFIFVKEFMQFQRNAPIDLGCSHAESLVSTSGHGDNSELLRIKHLTQSPKPFQDLIRQDIRRPNCVEMVTNIKQILNEALSRVTARFLNENYAKLNAVRGRILTQLNVSMEQLRPDFENQL